MGWGLARSVAMAEETRTIKKRLGVGTVVLVLAPMLGILVGVLAHYAGGMPVAAATTMAIALWTALWWVFEAVPLPVGSLVPLALLPLTGVLDAKQVGAAFGHHLILLLLGGFLLSAGMEKSGAHRRLALMMVNACGGTEGKRLVLGFMLATAVLSMWISNTATTLMMLPIAVAVLQNVRDREVAVPLLLGIAFAANVGGIATPIGTPPNLVFMAEFAKISGEEMTFLGWMKIGVPVSALMVVVIWLWLTRRLKGASPIKLPDPGKWRSAEVRTLGVFVVVAIFWVTRKEPGGGWSGWFGLENANDASVAFLGVIALFCIPDGEGKGHRLLDWESANKIPWGLLILMGSGMVLATAFKESGLSGSIAGLLDGLETLPPVVLIFGIAVMVTFLTELTSNTATTNLLMPILGAAALGSGLSPALLMIPAAVSASCAFMLPVATMPNAIVFGTGNVPIRRMVGEGFVLNLLGALAVTTVCYVMLG